MDAIKFDKVRFSYPVDENGNDDVFAESSTQFSIENLDFSVQKGEFVAVLGHNGSGKSTLARLVNGLLSPDSGKISVMDMDACDENNLFEIRKKVGIVFQNPDNQTVATIVEDDVAFGPENIGVARDEIGKRIDFALQAVGMEKYRSSTTSRLSGGQKQRIAIAGVLALKPEIIILDEATAMLDPRGRKEVIDVVLKLNKEENITVLLITHFPEEALLADRAVVMNGGKIVMEGTPAEVLSREEELKKCSLVLPRPLQICRELSRAGLSVADAYDYATLAKEIAGILPKNTQTATQTSREKGEPTSQEYSVYANNLSYTYNPSSPFATHALRGVNLEIRKGDFFGVIGHTGSGKSTFVQHLNGLIKLPTAHKKYKLKKGETFDTKLVVGGFDLTDKTTDFRSLRRKVGMVFQYPEYQLFAETVFEDVAFGLRNFCAEMTEEEVQNAVKVAIETVGLDYESVKDRSPFELSGGQKRRVAIAGVIVTKPEILVLDEPAAGLDPLGKEEIMRLLHDMHKSWCKTVIIVSHDMDEIAENCNRAAIFSQGKVLAVDTPKSLFSSCEITEKAGLDIPFVAKLLRALQTQGKTLDCEYTVDAFVQEILKITGAGTKRKGDNAYA